MMRRSWKRRLVHFRERRGSTGRVRRITFDECDISNWLRRSRLRGVKGVRGLLLENTIVQAML
jgi:hypothetical protein